MSSLPQNECFAIMPISDVEGYPSGHFMRVFEDIIRPAAKLAGFEPVRADQVRQTSLIHLDILNKLLVAPIAVCDLSTHNPNVLFELGIRQAFDKPVVLLQEKGTPRIFDIAPLRFYEYSKDMKYHEVIQSQRELAEAIAATVESNSQPSNVNSIVKLLALNKEAMIPNIESGKQHLAFEVLQAEMQGIKAMLEQVVQRTSIAQEGEVARRNLAKAKLARDMDAARSSSTDKATLLGRLQRLLADTGTKARQEPDPHMAMVYRDGVDSLIAMINDIESA